MDATGQPIRLASQLRQHLRSLRKSRGLTQTQLGSLLGVKQARVAEIESDPGAVSVDQLMRVFAVLGATLYLNPSDSSLTERVEPPKIRATFAGQKATAKGKQSKQRARTKAATPSRLSLASIPKKGTW